MEAAAAAVGRTLRADETSVLENGCTSRSREYLVQCAPRVSPSCNERRAEKDELGSECQCRSTRARVACPQGAAGCLCAEHTRRWAGISRHLRPDCFYVTESTAVAFGAAGRLCGRHARGPQRDHKLVPSPGTCALATRKLWEITRDHSCRVTPRSRHSDATAQSASAASLSIQVARRVQLFGLRPWDGEPCSRRVTSRCGGRRLLGSGACGHGGTASIRGVPAPVFSAADRIFSLRGRTIVAAGRRTVCGLLGARREQGEPLEALRERAPRRASLRRRERGESLQALRERASRRAFQYGSNNVLSKVSCALVPALP